MHKNGKILIYVNILDPIQLVDAMVSGGLGRSCKKSTKYGLNDEPRICKSPQGLASDFHAFMQRSGEIMRPVYAWLILEHAHTSDSF